MNPLTYLFKRAANPIFKSLGYEVIRVKDKVGHDYLYPLPAIIDAYTANNLNRDYFFIQIGANDGVSCAGFTEAIEILLSLYSTVWDGVLVEPIPSAMKKLKTKYATFDGLSFEQVAIADQNGEADFFIPTVDGKDLASSLDERQAKWATAGSKSKIDKIRVQTMTINSLICKYRRPVDFLCIDAEGYDGRILESLINSTAFRPAIIQFEHLWMEAREYRDIIALLRGAGYKTLPVNIDTLCVLQKP